MSTMVEILERIIETRGADCQWGLCKELVRADDFDHYIVFSIFEIWEHFSGNRWYPVPNPEYPADSARAAIIFELLDRGEGFLGEYGALRLDLARHLLRELSK